MTDARCCAAGSGHDVLMDQRSFFLYTRSRDLPASRRFYRDLLGLELIWDEPDSLAFALGTQVQLAIDLCPEAEPAAAWSAQPGWVYGLELDPVPARQPASWSIALAPQDFRAAVRRLQQAGVTALRSEPFWVGYWSYVVQDPMGQTVELSDPLSPAPAPSPQ